MRLDVKAPPRPKGLCGIALFSREIRSFGGWAVFLVFAYSTMADARAEQEALSEKDIQQHRHDPLGVGNTGSTLTWFNASHDEAGGMSHGAGTAQHVRIRANRRG